jgi:hypothetical protein
MLILPERLGLEERLRKFLGAAVTLFLTLAVSSAQSDIRNELSATVGRTFISDQTVPHTNFFDNTVHFGKGLTLDFDYARVLVRSSWGSLSAELPVLYTPDEDVNYGLNQVPKQYNSIFVTPAARVRFMENFAFSPWVSLGGGFAHFAASTDLESSGANPGHRIKTTGALHGGIGFDVPLPAKLHGLSFRFEALDNWSGVPPLNVDTGKTHQHNYYVGGGALFRF